jgi:hypothetical protein
MIHFAGNILVRATALWLGARLFFGWKPSPERNTGIGYPRARKQVTARYQDESSSKCKENL